MAEQATLSELAALRARVAALEEMQAPSRRRGRLPRTRWPGALLVAMLLLLPGALGASDRFGDVPDGAFYHDDAAAIADAGITLGCGGTNYCPDQAVTRGQMASFLARTAGLGGNPPVTNAASLGGVPADGYLQRGAADFGVVLSTTTLGPLPRPLPFTSHGGALLIVVNGSAFTGAQPNHIGVRVRLDGASVATLELLANVANTHLALVGSAEFVPGVSAGAHTLQLEAMTGTSSGLPFTTVTNGNDRFTVTILELPFD